MRADIEVGCVVQFVRGLASAAPQLSSCNILFICDCSEPIVKAVTGFPQPTHSDSAISTSVRIMLDQAA
jgi:hypothetical protein